jgi:hypothetical protein
VAACLASSTGETNGMFTTATPSRIRVVMAAAYPSVTMGSATLRYISPQAPSTGDSSRWNVHSEL